MHYNQIKYHNCQICIKGDLPRGFKDPRSALTHWEHVEHLQRMETLKIEHQCAIERLEKAKLENVYLKEERELKKGLLIAQTEQFKNSTTIVLSNENKLVKVCLY
jgi:hypothetical protein